MTEVTDSARLFEEFLAFLQTPPAAPDYLAAPSSEAEGFDPYQMVAEWVALRQEVKQQGKLLQTAQQTLKQALELTQSENEQLRSQLHQLESQVESQINQQVSAQGTAQQKQLDREREQLWKDLLKVLDALDYACLHWQDKKMTSLEISPSPQPEPKPQPESLSFWGQLSHYFAQLDQYFSSVSSNASSKTSSTEESTNPIQPSIQTVLDEILDSNRQGLELIRRSLLEVLQQRQITPIAAQGKPFDAQSMYAVGRQETDELPENSVYQEVVRGYRWGDRILREAQVVVAVRRTS